jgi:perosamine synthetase
MNQKRFIPVAAPALVGNEKKYVMDCLDSNWISSNGQYVERFERAFAEFCGTRHAISCCNGTAALHVALLSLGVGPGDEVIVPTLTFVASANAVAYCGAKPVFCDSEHETWNLDPTLLEKQITAKTKGIIAVHLYGHPVDMDPVLDLAKRRGLFVIEDAAEAHGAVYKGRRVGSIGDMGTFSFYGNKIITSGEGGMIVVNDDKLAGVARLLKGQGMDPARRYWFPIRGYNYRMTNVAAAIGLAQLEKADWHMSRRREIAAGYEQRLGGIQGLHLQPEKPWARNAYWISSVVLGSSVAVERDAVMKELAKQGIETRPFFPPMHTLPMYKDTAPASSFPVAESLSSRGFNLPSSANLKAEDLDYICDRLLDITGARPR